MVYKTPPWSAIPLLYGVLCLVLLQTSFVECGTTRKYYIAAEDITWDYAHNGTNLVQPDQQMDADFYLKQSEDRIGHEYEKTAYFEYTDETFSVIKPKPDYLGLTGPIIRAEVGDTIEIIYMNKAKGTYSIHTHGVFYTKNHEGALYMDGTSGRFKFDDIVETGKHVKLVWKVTEHDAPGANDPNCIPWVYHSHINTPKDTNTGLIGVLVTCKKGTLNSRNERTDVINDFPILVKIFDEGYTWHAEENLEKCLDPDQCTALHEDEDEDFVSSNSMHAFNGLMYGHLNGIEACVGKRYAFYVIGMGSEDDVHSVFFQGQNLKYQHTRGDTVSVYTATFVAAETTPTTAGTWIISDMVEGMAKAGLASFYQTKNCPDGDNATDSTGTTKDFFLSAEEIDWDYGPGGRDLYTGLELTDENSKGNPFFKKDNLTHIGGVYKKAQYIGYTDETYNAKLNREEDEEYMGLLGPVIEAEAGDTVKVVLKNDLPFDISFLPHGLSFEEDHNRNVEPGKTHTYTFEVPETILDGTGEDCLNFLYTSGTDPISGHAAGLMGPILICKQGYSKMQSKAGSLFLAITMIDENLSPLLNKTIEEFVPGGVDEDDEEFQSANIVFAINGFAYGTLPNMEMCLDDDVTVYAMSLGSNDDTHVLAFDGNTFSTKGKHRNVQELPPGTSVPLHLKPDNPGKWLLQSLNIGALEMGAYGLYDVVSCGKASPGPVTYTGERTYYIAAEEVEWDYAPKERLLTNGRDLNDFRVDGSIFVRDDDLFLGDMYRKAIYRQYEKDFKQLVERNVHDRHMGIIGPVIRAEVGDKVTVQFRNNANYPFSMHPHGVKYSHADSGKPYDGVDAGLNRGEVRTYTWYVPPRSGPGPSDPDCIPFLYYSGTHDERDVHTGLIGTLITCRKGTLDRDGRRKDKHPEYFILMTIFDENRSWFFDYNLRRRAPARVGTNYLEDDEFEESNKMHAINGHIFGNTPDLLMEYNKTVEIYMMVFGSRNDLHTIHIHGHTFLHTSNGHRDDVMSMFPGMAEVVTMRSDNPGTWLLHCHVLSHIEEGMDTTFRVLQPGQRIDMDDGSSGAKRTAVTMGLLDALIVLCVILHFEI